MSTPIPHTGRKRWRSRADRSGKPNGVSGSSRIIPHRYFDENDKGDWFRRMIRLRERTFWKKEMEHDSMFKEWESPDPLDQLDEVYRERNALVAFLVNRYDGVLMEEAEDWPEMGIVYIETKFGQMSWHIPAADFDLFEGVTRVSSYSWDGHTTEEKYGRLKALTEWIVSW